MPRFKMGKEKDLTDPSSLSKGDGRMYTGGTPDFDERTGQVKEPKPGRRRPKPGSPDWKTIMPVPMPGTPGRVGGLKPIIGRKPGLKTIQPVNPRKRGL